MEMLRSFYRGEEKECNGDSGSPEVTTQLPFAAPPPYLCTQQETEVQTWQELAHLCKANACLMAPSRVLLPGIPFLFLSFFFDYFNLAYYNFFQV